MPPSNTEIVRSLYEALNREDWDATFRDVHPEAEATFQRGPNAGTHRGRAAVESVLRDQRAGFDAWIVEPEELIEPDDQTVIALIRSRLRPKGTDAEFETRNGHIWTIRDGVIVSLRAFPNPDEALEAAGPAP